MGRRKRVHKGRTERRIDQDTNKARTQGGHVDYVAERLRSSTLFTLDHLWEASQAF